MDIEVKQYMVILRENVAELQRLGKEWGMTDAEILSCIDRSLEEEPVEHIKESPKSTARKIWLWIRLVLKWIFWIICLLFFIVVGLYVVSVLNPTAEFYISGLLQPYGYAIFRAVRLASLPVHKYWNITNLYDSECIIDNPWFQEPEFECTFCENIRQVKTLNGTDDEVLIKQYMTEARPVMFKQLAPSIVTYDDLKQLYKDNKNVLDKSVFSFHSTKETMTTIEDVFNDDFASSLPTSEGVSTVWQTKNVLASKVMRQLFPRPGFVPADSEVALEKTVFIDGPKSDHYELTSGYMQLGWYTQAHGHRKVLITPVKHCRSSCTPMHMHMDARDILMFNPTIWRIVILPNIRNISVGYVGSFSAPYPSE